MLARSGFDTPTPVTVINEEDLNRIGAADIADVISQIPAVRDTLNISSTSNLSSVAGGSYTDLRGLGFTRTLVLVDGRRYAPTTATGSVNTSNLPQVMIRGVDVVTGGASAAYGSDAVAGVVNYKMDDKLKGFKGRVQAGISDFNDYGNYLASLAYGTRLLGGRARLVVAAERAENDGIKYINSRTWNDNVAQVSNPAYTATNNEPRLITASNVRASNASYGGVITNTTGAASALRGIQFTPDGSAIPFTYGSLLTSTTMVGGDGTELTGFNTGAVPTKRHAFFGRLTADVSDAFSLFAEANYSTVRSHHLNVIQNEQLTIRRENPFLPQSVRDAMTAQNIATVTVGRSTRDNAREVFDLSLDTFRLIVGASGKLGRSWDWNVYYSGGWTTNELVRTNARISAKFPLALDAVVNPANGAIVCRSTLTDPTNGCVPINLIGEGRASQAALNYVSGTGIRHQDVRQELIAGVVRGEPFSTWAGPVGIAVGVEYRWSSVDLTSDPISQVLGFSSGGAIPYSGKVSVKEAFGEIEIPLALDASWAKNLSLNLAGRVTDYSTSGTVKTWKAGFNYAVNSSIRLRATQSRDIRAPSIENLFLGGATSLLNVFDPTLSATYNIQSRNTGNPFLTPEIGDTTTAGIVFTPSFIPGFRFSVDYYDIKLKSAIINLTPAQIVTQCYAGQTQLCAQIIRGPNPGDRITAVINGAANFQRLQVRGFDIEAAYNFRLGGGKVSLRTLATYIDKATVEDPLTGELELHDAVHQPTVTALGGNPRWRFTSRMTYAQNGTSISVAGRYVGGGRINPAFTLKDLDPLRVSGRLYFDVSAEQPLYKKSGDSVVLFGSIRNALNTTPPLTGVGGFGTTRALYDVIGRTYNAGARFRF